MQNMFHKIPAESVATTIVIPSEGLPKKYIANRRPPVKQVCVVGKLYITCCSYWDVHGT